MPTKQQNRISRIEKQMRPSKGLLVFWTDDHQNYQGGPIGSRDNFCSRADLDALEQEGWSIITVCYEDQASKPGGQEASLTA